MKVPDITWKTREEKRIIKKVFGIFMSQRKWIQKNMKELSFFQSGTESVRGIMKNTIDDEIEAFINRIPYKNKLATSIIDFIKIAMKRGGTKIVQELDMKSQYGISYRIDNPKARQILESRKDFELSNREGNIDSTTKKRIKEVLVSANISGESYNETAKKIEGLSDSGVFSKARGKLIAVREIGLAYEEGKAQVMNDFKSQFPDRQVLKKWQTVNDSRVTPTHRENQSLGWVDLSFVYDATGGDTEAPASDNPRCRCFMRHDIPKPKK